MVRPRLAQTGTQANDGGAPSCFAMRGVVRVGLREDKKEQTRDALIKAALALFQEKGFDATTIDDVTARAGVSRRTFFRYFNSKTELVSPFREERLANFARILKSDDGPLSPLDRVKFAMISLADGYESDAEIHIAIGSIIITHPTLFLQELFIEREWEDLIADALVVGDTDEHRRRQAKVVASAIVGVARQALRDWFDSQGKMRLKEEGAERLNILFDVMARAGIGAPADR